MAVQGHNTPKEDALCLCPDLPRSWRLPRGHGGRRARGVRSLTLAHVGADAKNLTEALTVCGMWNTDGTPAQRASSCATSSSTATIMPPPTIYNSSHLCILWRSRGLRPGALPAPLLLAVLRCRQGLGSGLGHLRDQGVAGLSGD